jgi:hypothetical protein
MLHAHIYVLLGIISHRHNFSLGSFNGTTWSGHFELFVSGGDDANDGLPILERYMKRFGGNDGHYRAPRQLYIAYKFRLHLQLVVISFYDSTAQAISIFQSDLIGECGACADRQNQQQEHISSQSNSPCVGRSSMGLAGLTYRARRKTLFDFT